MNILIVGASRGIGLEFVRQYSLAGSSVIATARNVEGLQRISELSGEGTAMAVELL